MYKATVTTNRIRVDNPDNEIMTSGSVNVNFIDFTFSEDWRGLFKTVLFQTKKALLPIALEGDELTYTMPIPWEVLVYAGEQINIGAYGTKSDDEETPEDEEIIMPTVWGSIPDKVKQGVIVSDPTPSSPTYNAYLYLLQLLEDIIEGGGGGGGTLDHSKLTNREIADQHPIDAITGLRDTLTSLSGQITEISTKVITDHGELTGRDSEDQHPMVAITGLVAKFTQTDRTIDQVISFIQSVASMLAGRSILFAVIDKAGLPKANDTKTYSRNEFVGIMPVVSEMVRVGFLILEGTLYLANYTVTDVQGTDTTVTFVSDPILIGPTSGGGDPDLSEYLKSSELGGLGIAFLTQNVTNLPSVNKITTMHVSGITGRIPDKGDVFKWFYYYENNLYYTEGTVKYIVSGSSIDVLVTKAPVMVTDLSDYYTKEEADNKFSSQITWLGYNDGTWNYVYDSQLGVWNDNTVFVYSFKHIIGNPDAGDPGIIFNFDKTGQYPPSLNLCTYKETVLGTDGNVSHHSAWSNVHIPMDTIPMVRNHEFRNGVEAREKLGLTTDGDRTNVWMADNVKLYLSGAGVLGGDDYIKLFGPVECWDTTFTPTAEQTSFSNCDRANHFRLFNGDTYTMPYKNHISTNDGDTYYWGYILEKPSSSGSTEVDIGIPIYKDLTITNGIQSRELIPPPSYNNPYVIFSNVRVEAPDTHDGSTYTGVYMISQHSYTDATVQNSYAFFVRSLDQAEEAYVFDSSVEGRPFAKVEVTQFAYSEEAIEEKIDAVSTGLPIFKDITITNGVQSEELFGDMTYKDMQAIFSNVRVETTDGKHNTYNGVVKLEQHSYSGDIEAFYVMDVDQCKYAYLYDYTAEGKPFTDLKEVQGEYKERNIPKQTMLTQAEYDALTNAEKAKGLYIVTEEGGSGGGSTGGSSLDIYSTEETRIGTWIDGKPFYRRVFTFHIENEADYNSRRIPTDLDYVFKIHRISGIKFIDTDPDLAIPITNYDTGSPARSGIISIKYNEKLAFQVYGLTTGDNYEIILEYTKTTDEPEVSS